MYTLDVDADLAIDHIWSTSKLIKKMRLDKKDIIKKHKEVCRLDPGGMLNMREEWVQFKVEEFKFEIQLSKLEWVLIKIKKSKERIPGCKRIGLFNYNVICSTKLADKLIAKLSELDKTDAAIHAQLDDTELKAKLENTGYIIFPDIPRES